MAIRFNNITNRKEALVFLKIFSPIKILLHIRKNIKKNIPIFYGKFQMECVILK
jgi:hypothetical protein